MTRLPGATTNPNRLHGLDYLRGVAALGVMVYHLTTWWLEPHPPTSPLGRIGIYAVSIFYVLSGITLYTVYHRSLVSLHDLVRFGVRRAFRILPLLWLVTFTAIALEGVQPSVRPLLLNLTGLFGFTDWTTYFSAGVWSIGNEIVFYAMFPLLVALTRVARGWMLAAAAVVFTAYVVFAFVALDEHVTVASQWSAYVNPGNQAALFVGGVMIAAFAGSHPLRGSTVALIAGMAGCALFLMPIGEGDSGLITGWTRIAMSIACFVLCGTLFRWRVALPPLAHRPLSWLGGVSYSIYLIHPLTYTAMTKTAAADWPPAVQIIVAMVTTLIVSGLVYRFIERPLTDVGRRIV